MLVRLFLNIAVLLLISHGISHAEYFRSGYPVCESEQRLDEFLEFAKTKNSEKIFEYTLERQLCVYAKEAEIQVLSLTSDGKARVLFLDAGIEGWVLVTAIGKRAQPPKENVIISDSDGASICKAISLFTRLPNAKGDAIAESVLATNLSSVTTTTRSYRQAIAAREYELVINWSSDRCVAEMDVPSKSPIACSLDYMKYYRCRAKQTSDVEACYDNLCVDSVVPNNLRDSPARTKPR